MTFTPEDKRKKNDMSTRTRAGGLRRSWWVVLLAVCLIAIGAYVFFIKPKEAARNKEAVPPPGIPVVAVEAKKADFNSYITGLGSVTPLNTVTVHTRVDGQLMEVLFREGQMVKSEDLLGRIDTRPFEAQLTQAEGQMARDLALLKNAQLDVERYRVLWEQDSIPKQQLDTQEALVRQLEGAVKNDQGLIDSAKVQLVYCRITAPINGRVGLRLVDPGNIVHTNDVNGLVVITQLQPITVTMFTSNTCRISSSLMSCTGAIFRPAPWLLMSTSSPPNRSTTVTISRFQSADAVASACTASNRFPPPSDFSAAFSRFASRPVMTTFAPISNNSRAASSPKPLEPPVMMTTLSRRSVSYQSSLLFFASRRDSPRQRACFVIHPPPPCQRGFRGTLTAVADAAGRFANPQSANPPRAAISP